MREIVFEYMGRSHSGKIISSTNIEPHYHWFYFTDSYLVRLINDDCIGFKKKNNELHPTKIFSAHTDLVETIKKVVEGHIN